MVLWDCYGPVHISCQLIQDYFFDTRLKWTLLADSGGFVFWFQYGGHGHGSCLYRSDEFSFQRRLTLLFHWRTYRLLLQKGYYAILPPS